jgi:hypothetical protein
LTEALGETETKPWVLGMCNDSKQERCEWPAISIDRDVQRFFKVPLGKDPTSP